MTRMGRKGWKVGNGKEEERGRGNEENIMKRKEEKYEKQGRKNEKNERKGREGEKGRKRKRKRRKCYGVCA